MNQRGFATISSVKAREIMDSRGNPTVEAEINLTNGIVASAISPSGASTGKFEAHELRDNDKNKFLGKSVGLAIKNINEKISPILNNVDSNDQEKIDKILIELDGFQQITPTSHSTQGRSRGLETLPWLI